MKKRPRSKDKNKLEQDRGLDFLVVQKMIWKFLSVDRIEIKEIRASKYTKKELAAKLRITVEELDKCKRNYFCKNILSRILLPAVTLYCSTKWVEDKSLK